MLKIVFCFLIPWFLHATVDSLFYGEEDPSFFEHVHVISGQLTLSLQDAVVNGAASFPLTRTYLGNSTPDIELKDLRGGWLVQGGWHMLPHTTLFMVNDEDRKKSKIYLAEQNGDVKTYFYFGQQEQNVISYQEEGGKILYLDERSETILLYLPRGGLRIYQKLGKKRQENSSWYLIKEILPSKHQICFFYDKEYKLLHIDLKNPSGSKTYSWVHFDIKNKGDSPYLFEVKTSDRKHLRYSALLEEDGGGLKQVLSNSRQVENVRYVKGQGESWPLVHQMTWGNDTEFTANYFPKSHKVQSLKAYLGREKEVSVAEFIYSEDYTDVKDAKGNLIRYYHKNNKVVEIVYFTSEGEIDSRLKFLWEGNLLCAKVFYKAEEVVSSKTFCYDAKGRVIKETLWGNVTGRPVAPFTLEQDGRLAGAESIVKTYVYDLEKGLLLYEKHGEISYKYVYKEGTDLIAAKFTADEQKVLFREFFIYNEDHILVEEIIDDGSSNNLEDRSDVTLCYSKRYTVNDTIGLPSSCREFYFDKLTQEEKLLRRTDYAYDKRFFIESENVYDANEVYRYTTYPKYDAQGKRIPAEILPGKQKPHFCDVRKFQRKVEENSAFQDSISFALAENDSVLEFTLLKKPLRVLHEDGSFSCYTYDQRGLLSEVIHSDGTKETYLYDSLQRVIYRGVQESSGKLIADESWLYSSFHLLSYTDIRGLTTAFAYDGAGRKIEEAAEGRVVSYEYDAFGFLEKEIKGEDFFIQRHGLDGSILEMWEEKAGSRENHIRFFYDKKGLLEKEERITSQGVAARFFFYDKEGRITEQRDPLGVVTKFFYEKTPRGIRKTRVTSLGVKIIEETNSRNQVLLQEKQDQDGKILSKEEFFYDDAGNKIQWVVGVYLEGEWKKEVITSFSYDSMHRMVKQIEAGERVNSFVYDIWGRLSSRVLPNGIILFFSYDGAGRIVELASSDGSIHYKYYYEKGPDPTLIVDTVNKTTFRRKYTIFGEVLEEGLLPLGKQIRFAYDSLGRRTCTQLPDGSRIEYLYDKGHLRSLHRRDSSGNLLYQHKYLKFDSTGALEEEELLGGLGKIQTKHDLLQRPYKQTSPWFFEEVVYGPTGLIVKNANSLFGDRSYKYDGLGQLKKEAEVFDSLGNLSCYNVDKYNQISSSADAFFSYDGTGNLIKKKGNQSESFYTYDALGRVTEIVSTSEKIYYRYDPFSRLVSKEIWRLKGTNWKKEDPVYFLYEGAKEIGVMSALGEISQLKVLGLGIRGDIGAAVAIELNKEVFAPLHDFYGNIIALVSLDGTIQEQYEMDPFGKEKLSTTSYKNPWRFCSKRHEEGLVYFGARFYDPSMGRWLTPDPSGFVDGLNLYAYVRNSPLNRLDVFGLSSWERNKSELFSLEVEISAIDYRQGALIPCRGIIEDAFLECYLAGGCLRHLEYTEEELESGRINLLNHFSEILPLEWRGVGLVTLHNGINTSLEEFKEMSQSVVDKISEGTLFIGMHTPTRGLVQDVIRFLWESQSYVTPIVFQTHQFMDVMVDKLHEVNPDLLWMDIRHSEGGVIGRRAIELLSEEKRNVLQKKLYSLTVGSGIPIPKEYGLHVYNIYSEADYWTGTFGYLVDDCDHIKIVPCISSWGERVVFADHAFMSPTYQSVLREEIENVRGLYGFHDVNSR